MLNSLIDVFFERSGTTLQKEVAVVIALVGQHLSNEYYPYFQVSFNSLFSMKPICWKIIIF